MRRVLSVPATALRASGNALGCGALAVAQQAGIKTVNTKSIRYKRLVNDRVHYCRNWSPSFSDNSWEGWKVQGHEREATENFGVYRRDSRRDPSMTLYTNDLKALPPIERYNAMLPFLAEKWKMRSSLTSFEKMKHAIEALECFEDITLTTGMLLSNMSEEHRNTYLGLVEAATTFGATADKQGHDAVAPALLRLAEIADVVRDTPTRVRALQLARNVASRMDSRGPLTDEALVKVKPPKPEKLKFLHAPETVAVGMMRTQKPQLSKNPEWYDRQQSTFDMLSLMN